MKEEALTKDEIEEILAESKKDKYSDPSVLMFGLKKTSIFRLSRETGLILIFGNEHIGYNHIIDRHSQTSRIPYWKNGKIGEPSKLPLGLAPIQYLSIEGRIYSPNNLKPSRENSLMDKRNFDLGLSMIKSYTGSVRSTLKYQDQSSLLNLKAIHSRCHPRSAGALIEILTN